MYERFTDQLRRVMQFANQSAQQFNHEYIGTEHLLLGLIRAGMRFYVNGCKVLEGLAIDLEKVRLEVERIIQAGPDMMTMGKLPQSPRAKKVIEHAIEEARNTSCDYVGTEHLLVGLILEKEGVAAQVLLNLGLTVDVVRQEITVSIKKDKNEGEKLPPSAQPIEEAEKPKEDPESPRVKSFKSYYTVLNLVIEDEGGKEREVKVVRFGGSCPTSILVNVIENQFDQNDSLIYCSINGCLCLARKEDEAVVTRLDQLENS